MRRDGHGGETTWGEVMLIMIHKKGPRDLAEKEDTELDVVEDDDDEAAAGPALQGAAAILRRFLVDLCLLYCGLRYT